MVLIAQLPPQRRARLRNAGPLAIPGVAHRKRLEAMTFAELTAALIPAPGGGFDSVPPAVPIGTLLRRFRHRLAGLDAMADQLRARAGELDPQDVRRLRSELAQLSEELRALPG